MLQILPFVPNLTLPCPSEGSQAPENCKSTCRSLQKKIRIISKRALGEGRLGLGGRAKPIPLGF